MRFSKNYIMKGVDFNCLFGLMGWFLNLKDLKGVKLTKNVSIQYTSILFSI